MKKKWSILIIIGILAILVFPIKAVYRDGGTVEYSAILYKVIKWNRIREYQENKTGTEVYLFPENLHSLEYYDPPRPEAIAIHNGEDFIVANIGTYQWSKKVDGITSHINACGLGAMAMEYEETVQITQGENVKINGLIYDIFKIKTYQYEGDEYKEIQNDLKYSQEVQEIQTEGMGIGTYIIELFAGDGNDKVCYSFKLKIIEEKI